MSPCLFTGMPVRVTTVASLPLLFAYFLYQTLRVPQGEGR